MNNFNPIYLEKQKEKKPYDFVGAAGGVGAGLVASNLPIWASVPVNKKIGVPANDAEYTYMMNKLGNLKVNGTNTVDNYLKSRGIKYGYGGPYPSPHFDIAKKKINLNLNPKYFDKWGIPLFAHELGHSEKLANNPKVVSRTNNYLLSKKVSGYAALLQLINCFNNDDESRQKIGRALSVSGGVTAVPMLAEEIGASMRGSKMLGLKGGQKARAFIGIGSYIAWALSPTIIYQVSEKTRKFLNTLRKQKQKHPEIGQEISELENQNIKVKI